MKMDRQSMELVVRKAVSYLSPSTWIQGGWGNYSRRGIGFQHPPVCGLGAIRMMGIETWGAYSDLLETDIEGFTRDTKGVSFMGYNDRPSTTLADVKREMRAYLFARYCYVPEAREFDRMTNVRIPPDYFPTIRIPVGWTVEQVKELV